jgi:hypothetical protein
VGGGRALAFYNGGGNSSAAALAAGPDGLYFSDLYKEDGGANPVARGAHILRMSYSPQLPSDCNGNGIPDLQEILAGSVQDCNQNGIPDECDVASGRSEDCNRNGIPDECDAVALVTSDFNAGTAPWTLNGTATRINDQIRLTSAVGNQLGSMVRPPISLTPISGFDISFDLRIGGGSGADGMSFAAFDSVRYSQNALFGEEGPGSTDSNAAGPGTLVVQFDTYDNGNEGENSIDVTRDGVLIGHYSPSFDLEDFVTHRAHIRVRSNLLNMTITRADGSTENVYTDLPVAFANVPARFGFGGRTGGATDEHWVDNVVFRVPGPADRNGDGVLDVCACLADFNRDGSLDFFDYLDFVAAFASTSSAADFNHDSIVDFFDYLDFVNAFSLGC